MNSVVKMLLGIIIMLLGVGTYYFWYPELIIMLKGGIGLIILMVGFVMFLIGKEERAFEKEEKELEEELEKEKKKSEPKKSTKKTSRKTTKTTKKTNKKK